MGLFNWFFDLTRSTGETSLALHESTFVDDFEVNPANGLPMLDGIGSVDVGGNPFGYDFSHDTISFDSSSTGFDSDW